MKRLLFIGALVALTGFASSCTFSTMVANSGKVKVSIAAPKASKATAPKSIAAKKALAKSLAAAKTATKKFGRHSASLARSASRYSRVKELSASQDVASATYTVIDLNGYEQTYSDYFDPSSPYIDVYLTPENPYRIIIDVELTSSAATTAGAVGITRYGDQIDMYADYGGGYVDMYVHPTEVPVFDQKLAAGTPLTATYWQAGTTSSPLSVATTGSPPTTADSADKISFSADGGLYYFNKVAQRVYQFTGLTSPIPGSDAEYIDFSTVLGGTVSVHAFAPEPSYPGYFLAVGEEVSGASQVWRYYEIYDTGAGFSVSQSADISGDLGAGLTNPTIVPTGITLDPATLEIFVSGYAYASSSPICSTLYAYDYYSGFNFVYLVTQLTSATDGLFTDVSWENGRLWTMVSPPSLSTINTVATTSTAYSGIANLVALDAQLDPTIGLSSSVLTSYNSSISLPASVGPSPLSLPNRFSAPMSGSRIYITQSDPLNNINGSNLMYVDIDTGDVQAITTPSGL